MRERENASLAHAAGGDQQFEDRRRNILNLNVNPRLDPKRTKQSLLFHDVSQPRPSAKQCIWQQHREERARARNGGGRQVRGWLADGAVGCIAHTHTPTHLSQRGGSTATGQPGLIGGVGGSDGGGGASREEEEEEEEAAPESRSTGSGRVNGGGGGGGRETDLGKLRS